MSRPIIYGRAWSQRFVTTLRNVTVSAGWGWSRVIGCQLYLVPAAPHDGGLVRLLSRVSDTPARRCPVICLQRRRC